MVDRDVLRRRLQEDPPDLSVPPEAVKKRYRVPFSVGGKEDERVIEAEGPSAATLMLKSEYGDRSYDVRITGPVTVAA